MDLRQIREEAKSKLVSNLEVGILWGLIILIESAALYAGGTLAFVGSILALPLGIGIFSIGLDLLQDKKIDFNKLIDGYRDLNHAINFAVVGLIYLLIVSIGFVLFIVPGIYFGIKYSQAAFIIIEDKKVGIIDAFKKSSEMMEGHKMELFEFYLGFILHFLLVIGTCGLWTLVLAPYLRLALINYYRYLTKKDYIEL